MSIFSNVDAQRIVTHRLDRDRIVGGNRRTGFIYIIEKYPYAKIGFSVRPEIRLKELQVAAAEKLKLLCVAPGSMLLEQRIHAILRDAGLCVRGEWYLLDDILHVFEALHRITLSAISAANGEPPSKAEFVSERVYYFKFQWCCHDCFSQSNASLYQHLTRDHDLDFEQARAMSKRYREDPTLMGIKCRGEVCDD